MIQLNFYNVKLSRGAKWALMFGVLLIIVLGLMLGGIPIPLYIYQIFRPLYDILWDIKTYNCPDVGESPIVVYQSDYTRIFFSNPGTLCTLTLIQASNTSQKFQFIAPAARSYEGNNWENVRGPYNLKFDCFKTACRTSIPMFPTNTTQSLVLQTFSKNDLNFSLQDIASRFLEQATFGPTTETIAALTDGISNETELNTNFNSWVYDQMYSIPATSHREFFREGSNTRYRSTQKSGSPLNPCSPKSRWHSYTFNAKDVDAIIQVSGTENSSTFLLSIDGFPRTEVDSVEVKDNHFLEIGKSYRICRITEKTRSTLMVFVGGSCRRFIEGNPRIMFSSLNPAIPPHTINLAPERKTDFTTLSGGSKGDDFINEKGLKESICDLQVGAYPVYINFSDGDWLSFDPRINLSDNTLINPAPDGGGTQEIQGAECSNVARTFLNEDSCVLSTQAVACGPHIELPEANVPLTTESIIKLHEVTGNYVYAISGLKPHNSPCVQNTRSRWVLVEASKCLPSVNIDDETKRTLVELLKNDDGTATRDIFYTDGTCNIDTTTPSSEASIMIQIDSMCWQLMHPDHNNVLDMTLWVSKHPGGPEKITQFLSNGKAFLEFPDWHDVKQWEDNRHLFPMLGLFGKSTLFRDLPANLRLESVAKQFGVEGILTSGKDIFVCGSPGEVGNNHSLGETGYNMRLSPDEDDFSPGYLGKQKHFVWATIILTSSDQLRQRMAWALSQILAISPDAVVGNFQTELFLVYYDIFIRNAFGNYRDVLKEVAYSPLMAQMLSYRASKSAAYNLKSRRTINFADENFAREVMQLFTMGPVKLNKDGTPMLDPITNSPVQTYTNDHIMSFARAWTGFEYQSARGNIEILSSNFIDPMRIIPQWRDVFPKINLSGGYIGDGYPLCVDMPDRFFLRKGAKYRLLGSSTVLELHSNPPDNIDAFATRMILSKESDLYAKLCNPSPKGEDDCKWQNEIILDENLKCTGQECFVDTLQLIQVTDTIFFEYLDPPCVRLSYYDNAKKISNYKNEQAMCADPRSISASEACCDSKKFVATERNCEYVGERMKYDTAVERCQAIGLDSCEFRRFGECNSRCCVGKHNSFWHNASCELKVKVDETGYVSLVHQPLNTKEKSIRQDLRRDTINFFPVHWAEEYPSLSNKCGMGVCEISDNVCVCNIKVTETPVFGFMPRDVKEILSELHIGSFNPEAFDSKSYRSPITNRRRGIKVYLYRYTSFDLDKILKGRNGSYDQNTVFEVKVNDSIKYFRNARSDVRIVDAHGETTKFIFRNPPHFMNLVDSDAKDAHYETDAVLDDYFHHPNTAPFLATFFIQRFGNSNPSPRYVEQVASAFISGKYEGRFGTGEYGDLGAMTAAIVLDQEARSIVLNMDSTFGSLKEPLVKLVSYMRSMHYVSFNNFERRTMLFGVADKIGQMAHEIKSVFSFFEQDYTPDGPVKVASLVAPESEIYESLTVIKLLNGLYSMTKYGLSSCFGGFGQGCRNREEGDFQSSQGKLSFIPSEPNDADSVVNELATLLTAGRLNQVSRDIIKNQFVHAEDKESGLRLAQQLVVSSPEFHSTSRLEFSGEKRESKKPMKSSEKNDYKSVVYLFLKGGVDSYNILVPHSDCKGKDMFSEYLAVREEVALPKDQLLAIGTGGEQQVCDRFGIHPELPVLHSLYEDGDALFVANAGVLFEPVSKQSWSDKTKTQLFAHNVQTRDTQQVDAFQKHVGTGVLGRMADMLTGKGFSTGSFSIKSGKISLVGPLSSPIYSLEENGLVNGFNAQPSGANMSSLIADINNVTNPNSGIFGKTWSDLLDKSISEIAELSLRLGEVQVSEMFPNTDIGKRFKTISTAIKARTGLKMERQFFLTEFNGFDTHKNLHEILNRKFSEIDKALESFMKEMKDQGVWDDVLLVVASDFGRSLTPNSGGGTDHSWGGNYFVVGGGLDGGRILGSYPDDLTSDGSLILKRGRVIPTTSWDSILNGVAEWVGIKNDTDLDAVLPNRRKFGNDILEKSDLFGGAKKSKGFKRSEQFCWFCIILSSFLSLVLIF